MSRTIAGTLLNSYVDTSTNLILEATIDSGTIPTTASLYAPGSKVLDLSTGIRYTNTGTTAVPVFTAEGLSSIPGLQLAITTLTPAQIIATTAGSLSHAQGLIAVPAAPAGFVNVLHRAIVSYTFGTAAYTGGGNTTFNIGAGGAALTGLIATTTLWQNASSIIQMFVPLSTVAFPITTATSINLVTASAITNPGTAAGTAKVYVWYSQVAI
jgi:hypothetical protein